MPTFSQDIDDNRIIIQVSITREAGEPDRLFSALLDTGAQVTALAPNVIKAISIIPTGEIDLAVASGQEVKAFEYNVRVDVPVGNSAGATREPTRSSMGTQLFVAGLPYQPDGYDAILGMDFIGMFHMTIHQDRIILSV